MSERPIHDRIDVMERMIMYSLPEQLERERQHDLLRAAHSPQQARLLLRMRRAERRAERLQALARARAAAAADARRAVVAAAQL